MFIPFINIKLDIRISKKVEEIHIKDKYYKKQKK